MFLSTLQVTYRVVQVTDQPLEGRDDGGGAVSVVSTAAFSGAPQAVAQVLDCLHFVKYCRKSTDHRKSCKRKSYMLLSESNATVVIANISAFLTLQCVLKN